jgi:hypothetical protein
MISLIHFPNIASTMDFISIPTFVSQTWLIAKAQGLMASSGRIDDEQIMCVYHHESKNPKKYEV